MKITRIAFAFICTLLCLVGIATSVLFISFSRQQPTGRYSQPSTKDAPIYPGASHLTSDTASTVNVKYYEFQTQDKPAKVLNFYRDVLSKDGWQERAMPSGWESHAAHFMLYDTDGQGYFSLELDAPIRSTDNTTHVTIKLEGEPGGW